MQFVHLFMNLSLTVIQHDSSLDKAREKPAVSSLLPYYFSQEMWETCKRRSQIQLPCLATHVY